jgi:DNA-binding IclR family transcriptional regulator
LRALGEDSTPHTLATIAAAASVSPQEASLMLDRLALLGLVAWTGRAWKLTEAAVELIAPPDGELDIRSREGHPAPDPSG